MDHTVCPGAKFLRQPRPEMFPCPDCGEEVEIWSDEIRGTCSACGRNVFRDGLPSCVEWCKYGKECVGEEAYGTYQRNRALGFKHRLLEVLQRRELLSPAEAGVRERAVAWAEAILAGEPTSWHLVIPAVIVHDVPFQEDSGKESLEWLLHAQGLDADDVNAVRRILQDLSPGGGAPQGLEARIVRDAWSLAELGEDGIHPRTQEPALLERLLTPTANRLAREHLSAGSGRAPSAAGAGLPGKMEDSDA
jgi:hypothetical protein